MSTNPTGSLGFQRWTQRAAVLTPVVSAPLTIVGDGALLVLQGLTPGQTQFIELRDSSGVLRGFVGFPTAASDLMITRNVTPAGQTNMVGNGEMFMESTGDDVHVVSDAGDVALSSAGQIDAQSEILYSGLPIADPTGTDIVITAGLVISPRV